MRIFWNFVRWFTIPPPSDSAGKDPMLNELHRDFKRILGALLSAFLVGIGALVWMAIWQVFAKGYVICFWALTCAASGLLLGFLFGIPKVLQKDVPADDTEAKKEGGDGGRKKNTDYRLLVNTNLDDVSDWLTKIVLGVSLVELQKMPGLLNRLAGLISGELNNDDKLKAFVVAVILYFAIIGFMMGYFATRLFIQRAFRIADLYSSTIRAEGWSMEESTAIASAASAGTAATGSAYSKKAGD
jgi:hypothetical protein